jgi:hypothetical protein
MEREELMTIDDPLSLRDESAIMTVDSVGARRRRMRHGTGDRQDRDVTAPVDHHPCGASTGSALSTVDADDTIWGELAGRLLTDGIGPTFPSANPRCPDHARRPLGPRRPRSTTRSNHDVQAHPVGNRPDRVGMASPSRG